MKVENSGFWERMCEMLCAVEVVRTAERIKSAAEKAAIVGGRCMWKRRRRMRSVKSEVKTVQCENEN